MSFYEDLVMQTQMNYSRYYSVYASGGTPYELSDKKPLPYKEQIEELVRQVKEAECVIVGGASGLSAAGGGDFYYGDTPSYRKYFGKFAEKYGFKGAFDGMMHQFTTREEYWGYLATFLNTTLHAPVRKTYLDLDAVLRSLEIPEKLIVLFSEIMENIFDLVWSCGVQTVLFIAGLQTIPDALYEVSRVEGSNKWEEFWFINFPMLNNTFVLVIVYTMIGIVTDKNNTMMKMPFQLMTQSQIYDESSARLWLYFAIVGALMSVVMFAYKRLLARRWE